MPMPIIGETSLYKVVTSLRELWQLVLGLQATRWERIGRVVVSASTAQLDFPLSRAYRSLRITACGVSWATNGVPATLQVLVSEDGGNSFLAAAMVQSFIIGTTANANVPGEALLVSTGASVAAGENGGGYVNMDGAEQAGDVHVDASHHDADGAGFRGVTQSGRIAATGPINFIRLMASGSNIDAGTFIVEGLRSP